jgi:hypothetical protein
MGEPGAGQPLGPEPGHVVAAEAHGARRGGQQSRDSPEQRRLAGAVGPDDRHQFAVGGVEVDAVQHGQPAVAGVQTTDLQAHEGPAGPASATATASASSGSTPR